jgi:hypothetical protein
MTHDTALSMVRRHALRIRETAHGPRASRALSHLLQDERDLLERNAGGTLGWQLTGAADHGARTS